MFDDVSVGGVLREFEGEKVDASRYMRSHGRRRRVTQEKDVVPDASKKNKKKKKKKRLKMRLKDVVAVVNVKKNAQKMKKYNLNNKER